MTAAGHCIDCGTELPQGADFGRCLDCRVAALPLVLREAAGATEGDKPHCPVCGCLERLHAPLAPWCAGCGAPCPPAEPAPQTDEKQKRVLTAPARYAERRR